MKVKKEFRDDKEAINEAIPSTSQQLLSSSFRPLNIEKEIARLRSQLAPIDFDAAANDVFEDFSTLDDYGEPVNCTCTFREEITFLEDEVAPVDDGIVAPPKIEVKNGVSEKPDDSEEDETDDFCAVDDGDDDLSTKSSPIPRSAVKSIFDPEYDANENLIEEMVRRKPRENASKVIEVMIEKGAVKPMRIEPLIVPPIPELERVPIVNYVCDEDPMCPARAHFQRDPVTTDDVERLHKKFINGVNGFWNGIPEEKPPHDFKNDMENIDYAKQQLWKRVVPRYDFLTCDKIPKTFDDDSPFSLPPLPPQELEEEKKPFDGFKDKSDIEFREWHEVMNVRSYNDDVLTILPYVIID